MKKKMMLLLLIMTMTMAMCSIAFADVVIETNDKEYSVPEYSAYIPTDCDYTLIATADANRYLLCTYSEKVALAYCDIGGGRFSLKSIGGSYSAYWVNSSGAWEYVTDGGEINWGTFDCVLTSTKNVLAEDEETVFFHAPKTGLLTKKLRTVPMAGALNWVILLIPLVVLAIVSYLGLRKALALLLSRLRRA